MAGCGGCGNCGGNCSKKSGWRPVAYYIMYTMNIIVDIGGGRTGWESVKKVELLKNATDKEKAKIEAGKWLREMRKRENDLFRIDNARLVVSTHKDILKLI